MIRLACPRDGTDAAHVAAFTDRAPMCGFAPSLLRALRSQVELALRSC